MQKKAFVSISYKNKDRLSSEIHTISEALKQYAIEPVVFACKYSFTATQEKKMMEKAIKEIQMCDFLIAEVSDKVIGVGIEIGYAYGLGKPIIYLRKHNAEYSTTVGGLTSKQVIYTTVEDLRNQLIETLQNIAFSQTKKPYVGVAVVVKKDNKVLLGKRKNSHGAGSWNLANPLRNVPYVRPRKKLA